VEHSVFYKLFINPNIQAGQVTESFSYYL